MKRTKHIALFLTVLLTIGTLAFGQVPDNAPPPTTPTVIGDLKDVAKAVVLPSDFKSFAIATYATYAPDAPGTKVGGGILALYNLNAYTAVSTGVDWLGEFNLVSGNATLRLPISLKRYGLDAEVTPFVLGGIGTPFGGAGASNGKLAPMYDVGGNIAFGHFMGGRFGVGACWGKWLGSGAYSGDRYHAFLNWAKGF